MYGDFDSDYEVSEALVPTQPQGIPISIFGNQHYTNWSMKHDRIVYTITTGFKVNDKEYYVYYRPTFEATFMMQNGGECLWFNGEGKIIAKTASPIRQDDSPRCKLPIYQDQWHLICMDGVYVGNFAKKIAIDQPIGGRYWNGEFFVWSAKQLFNITAGYEIDVSVIQKDEIVSFDGGTVVLASNKAIPLYCSDEQKQAKEDECIICYGTPPKFKTYNCGHCIVCEQCHERGKFAKCPECRADITVAITTLLRKKK